MRQEIEAYRLERQIPYLLHFTRAENLPSILAHGLVPRSEIDNGNFCGVTNDAGRYDQRRNFNCLSATFPNSSMFFKLRGANPGVDWVVLAVHPVIMAHQHTLFCWQNAATNEISHTDENALSSLASFKELFEERVGHPTRAEQFLKPCDPTHVQAEILVQGTIQPNYIFCAIFPSVPCQQNYAAHVGAKQSIVSNQRGFYGDRRYYRQWGHGKNG